MSEDLLKKADEYIGKAILAAAEFQQLIKTNNKIVKLYTKHLG
jgi:hypothetical protein